MTSIIQQSSATGDRPNKKYKHRNTEKMRNQAIMSSRKEATFEVHQSNDDLGEEARVSEVVVAEVLDEPLGIEGIDDNLSSSSAFDNKPLYSSTSILSLPLRHSS
jgi:hypothetical protein